MRVRFKLLAGADGQDALTISNDDAGPHQAIAYSILLQTLSDTSDSIPRLMRQELIIFNCCDSYGHWFRWLHPFHSVTSPIYKDLQNL